jgi:hypothetical protein
MEATEVLRDGRAQCSKKFCGGRKFYSGSCDGMRVSMQDMLPAVDRMEDICQ